MTLPFLGLIYIASPTAKYFANLKWGSGPYINSHASLTSFLLEYLKTFYNFLARQVNLSLSCGHWEDKSKDSSTELHSNSAFQWSTCRMLFFTLSTRRILSSEVISRFGMWAENKSHYLYVCRMSPRILSDHSEQNRGLFLLVKDGTWGCNRF